jgi:dCMP deaminase
MSDKWHRRFLAVAELVAGWSKDPSTQVGAVATRDRRILATGYNGLPIGVMDTDDRLRLRELKYAMIAHAEANCITHAASAGVSLAGATIYVWPFHPCSSCAGLLINSGIKRVVILEAEIPERWQFSFGTAKQMFEEAGIELIEIAPAEGD